MTVIATVITQYFTTHASDSFLTVARGNGTREVVEDKATKLIRVPAWRGAIAYWGLARFGKDWNTPGWLQEQAARADRSGSSKGFASALATGLNEELGRRALSKSVDGGIGIHFTAYEHIGGNWIPELFMISNWADSSYSAVRPSGITVTRETYATLKNLRDRPPDQREPDRRREVHSALHRNTMFRFNNGDPVLFNPVANSIVNTFVTLFHRRHLRDPASVKTHLSLARRPVDVVSRLLADLAEPSCRVIGGKPHDLAISPNGEYHSSTGD